MSFPANPRPAYGNCDSYFVESADAGVYPSRQALREMKKIRQEEIANELSRLAYEEHVEDVVQHMSRMENETLPDVASIDIQEEIQWFMRPYLLDFLIEAHAFFQLLPETLFLAINLLDRYCSKRVVYKRHYQLVGCASLLIAAKYGDRKDRVPTIRELKSMCCGLYDEEMFTQMEWHVLNTLDWIIGHPTVDSFLQLNLVEDDDVELEHMAWYILEIALYHKEFVSIKPSVMAWASLALARDILQRPQTSDGNWSDTASVTVYSLGQRLHQPSQVLSKKYASPYFSRVSAILENVLAQQAAINRCAAPPTPPCLEVAAEKPVSNPNIYSTPQKMAHGVMVNGYLTPPITPDGNYFLAGDAAKSYMPAHPITPSPASASHYRQSYQGYSQNIIH